jgi:hypothetical protein
LNQTFASFNIIPVIPRNRQRTVQNTTAVLITQLESSSEIIKLDNEPLRHLSFTKIIEGRFANISSKSWRSLINNGLKIAVEKGIGIEVLENRLEANFKTGSYNKDGYKFVDGTNFSLQYQDASKVANNLLKLAKLLDCELYVLLEWQEKGKFPMRQGLIHWKP